MWTKQTWIAVVLVVSVGSACRLAAEDTPGQKEAPTPKDTEKALKKALLDDARKVFEQNQVRYQTGAVGIDVELMSNWSIRWLEAELELAADAAGKSAALKAHLGRMKDVEKFATALAKTGQGREADAVAGRYFRTQAELWLARGRMK